MKNLSALFAFAMVLLFTISCESDVNQSETDSLYSKIEDTLSPDTDDKEVDQRDNDN